jgi:membrane-associated phospholipid phosphatase
MAGYHFISDTIGGAVVGSSVGFIVSALHKSPVQIVPVVNHDAAGNVSGGGVGLVGSL